MWFWKTARPWDVTPSCTASLLWSCIQQTDRTVVTGKKWLSELLQYSTNFHSRTFSLTLQIQNASQVLSLLLWHDYKPISIKKQHDWTGSTQMYNTSNELNWPKCTEQAARMKCTDPNVQHKQHEWTELTQMYNTSNELNWPKCTTQAAWMKSTDPGSREHVNAVCVEVPRCVDVDLLTRRRT